MFEERSGYWFTVGQEETRFVLAQLREKKRQGQLSGRQERQLLCMEQRYAEGRICLLPALIYAAANQENCQRFFRNVRPEQLEVWRQAGVAWLRFYPSFLDWIGWRERIYAVYASGLFALAAGIDRPLEDMTEELSAKEPAAETKAVVFDTGKRALQPFRSRRAPLAAVGEEAMVWQTAPMGAGGTAWQHDRAGAEDAVRRLLSGSWHFMWHQVKQLQELTAKDWEELLRPWQDSEAMACGMAAVLLLTAWLQKKIVQDVDQICRSLYRLKHFSDRCLKAAQMEKIAETDSRAMMTGVWKQEGHIWEKGLQEYRMAWLLEHFKNPHRPAYLKEKSRLSSQWLEALFHVMEQAGLPRSACENMTLSCSEIYTLLSCLDDKMTERQYMTFLLLYAVSKELAEAGQAALVRGQAGAGEFCLQMYRNMLE